MVGFWINFKESTLLLNDLDMVYEIKEGCKVISNFLA